MQHLFKVFVTFEYWLKTGKIQDEYNLFTVVDVEDTQRMFCLVLSWFLHKFQISLDHVLLICFQ